MTPLCIVIPVYNRCAMARRCLQALSLQTVRDFQVIVIDDGSTDGTRGMLRSEFPQVQLLEGRELWWSAATNLGVHAALERGAGAILTLNDDTLPPRDFLEHMLHWHARRPAALLGALQVDARTGRPLLGGERARWDGRRNLDVLRTLPPQQQYGLHPATHLPGRGMLIPAAVFRSIGLFAADRLPQSAADFDFTHRAWRAGFEVYCNYDARLGVFPEMTGGAAFRGSAGFRNYARNLFSLKGDANLRVFTWYALRNCPPALLPWYLLQGYARRLLGYWIHALAGSRRGWEPAAR